MFGLFRKKCEFCKKTLERKEVVKKRVFVPEFTTKHFRDFCSEKHAEEFEDYVRNIPQRPSLCSSCPIPPERSNDKQLE